MALEMDPNGTHFLIYDPEALPEKDRELRLQDILADPAAFVWAY